MSLEFYAYPHLVGEAADYEIDESEEEEEEKKKADADKMEEDVAEGEEDKGKDLPGRWRGSPFSTPRATSRWGCESRTPVCRGLVRCLGGGDGAVGCALGASNRRPAALTIRDMDV